MRNYKVGVGRTNCDTTIHNTHNKQIILKNKKSNQIKNKKLLVSTFVLGVFFLDKALGAKLSIKKER